MPISRQEIRARMLWNRANSPSQGARALVRDSVFASHSDAEEFLTERFAIYREHLGGDAFPHYCLNGDGRFDDAMGILPRDEAPAPAHDITAPAMR